MPSSSPFPSDNPTLTSHKFGGASSSAHSSSKYRKEDNDGSTTSSSKKKREQVFLPAQIIGDFVQSPLFAGAVACSIAAIPSIPYNNIIFSSKNSNPSLREAIAAATVIVKREGFWNFRRNTNRKGLMRCATPAIAGQFFYGGALFFFFEMFKSRFLNDEINKETGRKKNILSEITVSAFGAEFWACFFLAPFECAYGNMLMNSSKDFPQTMGAAFKELASKPSQYGFPFRSSLRTLWSTGMMKTAITFCLFEIFCGSFANSHREQTQARQASLMASGTMSNSELMAMTSKEHAGKDVPRSTSLNVSFAAGALAGCAYEAFTHPFENMGAFRKNPLPMTLWKGLGPKLWVSGFSSGMMWLTFDFITGKNRLAY